MFIRYNNPEVVINKATEIGVDIDKKLVHMTNNSVEFAQLTNYEITELCKYCKDTKKFFRLDTTTELNPFLVSDVLDDVDKIGKVPKLSYEIKNKPINQPNNNNFSSFLIFNNMNKNRRSYNSRVDKRGRRSFDDFEDLLINEEDQEFLNDDTNETFSRKKACKSRSFNYEDDETMLYDNEDEMISDDNLTEMMFTDDELCEMDPENCEDIEEMMFSEEELDEVSEGLEVEEDFDTFSHKNFSRKPFRRNKKSYSKSDLKRLTFTQDEILNAEVDTENVVDEIKENIEETSDMDCFSARIRKSRKFSDEEDKKEDDEEDENKDQEDQEDQEGQEEKVEDKPNEETKVDEDDDDDDDDDEDSDDSNNKSRDTKSSRKSYSAIGSIFSKSFSNNSVSFNRHEFINKMNKRNA